MNLSPYNLLSANGNSNEFYSKLSDFTDIILSNAKKRLSTYVHRFIEYHEKSGKEPLRSFEEYLLEYIMIGILWRNYSLNAASSFSLPIALLNLLYEFRNCSKVIKSYIDKIRGFIAYRFLGAVNGKSLNFNLTDFEKLLKWLDATGEFREEAIRLRYWAVFFTACESSEVYDMLSATYSYSSYFFLQGKNIISEYTCGIDEFRSNNTKKYHYREDYFFTQRSEGEYYLNMVGAEILNRQFKNEFEKTTFKILLLPTCMKNTYKTQCKAKWDGIGMICTKCSESCNIGNLAKQITEQSVKIYLISHFSDFTLSLNNWSNQRETGLVGAACILNLLAAGLKMKRLNIPSQCVFLDYCGCKKHWDEDENPTSLNVHKLKKAIFPSYSYK